MTATTITITYDPATVPMGSTMRLYSRADNSSIGDDQIADGSGSTTFSAASSYLDQIKLMAYDGPNVNIDVQAITVSLS